MATERNLETETYQANADLSTKRNYIVKITGTDQVGLATAGSVNVGVLKNKPAASGRAAAVQILGLSKVISDGSGTAIAAGDPLGSDASGRAIKVSAAGAQALGFAEEPSTAANVIIGIRLTGPFTLAG